ncbi:phage terminase small subunit P27 family [Paenibacillus caseinilyticus]|uniref:phage terminase small subunit P27 family n=1 Tax=Paenibacillus caseinilyticus TaxID=3098138 RepID=UPI0022B912FD|nr:phage terminase small subunit P27 family [Paenibacillus caseinilyticus]MCZ8518874.1 phage terminase small subunit P27 family [Paenibacillus caseinilyticus]
MPRGRPPKPTHLKVLTGNPGKRPLNENEPKPKPIAPKCPSWLDSEAKKEWKRVAPELEKLGLLTVVDGATFAAYCQSWSLYHSAQRAVIAWQKKYKKLTMTYTNTLGAENEVPIPEIAIAEKALKQVKAFCTEFGLTPSARGRMRLPSGGEEDEFEDYLRRSK